MNINELVKRAHENARAKGFWPEEEKFNVGEKLALIHSEVSEALECHRDGELVTKLRVDGKPEGFPSELADIIIRVGDLCGRMNIDLVFEIEQKMAYNSTRPAKHGKNY